MDTHQIQRGCVQANGAELYYETRGDGPPVLLIAGVLADAGQFTALGDALAEQRKVITYDRRGNSRSPAPPAGPAPPSTSRPTTSPLSWRPWRSGGPWTSSSGRTCLSARASGARRL